MRTVIIVCCAVCMLARLQAGAQQQFFLATVQKATRVRVVKVGPDQSADGSMRQHVLLDATTKRKVAEVASVLELVDPRPESRDKDQEVWHGSRLAFGVAEYLIEFFQDDRNLLSFGMDSSMGFVTPFGAHAPQGNEMLLDYPLSGMSKKKMQNLISGLKEEPNHPAEPASPSRAGSP